MSPQMGQELALALALEGRTAGAQPEVKNLVAVAGMLASLPEPEIDATFAAALEQRLMNEGLEQAPVGRPQLTVVRSEPAAPAEAPYRAPVVQMPSRRLVVRKSVVAIAACVAMSAFPAVAAAKSLPGSPFYGLKTLQHKLELALARGPVADGMKHAEFAAEIAGDAAQLAAFPEPNRNAIDEALRRVNAELKQAEALVLENTRDASTLTELVALAQKSAAGAVAAASAATDANVAAVLRSTQSIVQATADALGSTIGSHVAQVATSTTAAASVTSIDPAKTQRTTTVAGDGGSKKITTKPQPKDDGDAGPGGTGKAVDPAKRQACKAVFSEQLGNTLQYVSDVACGMDHG